MSNDISSIDCASLVDTIAKLVELGFVGANGVNEEELFMHNTLGVSVKIYLSTAGWYCVDVEDGSWKAPVVWKGKRAEWDKTTEQEDDKEFMDFISTL